MSMMKVMLGGNLDRRGHGVLANGCMRYVDGNSEFMSVKKFGTL